MSKVFVNPQNVRYDAVLIINAIPGLLFSDCSISSNYPSTFKNKFKAQNTPLKTLLLSFLILFLAIVLAQQASTLTLLSDLKISGSKFSERLQIKRPAYKRGTRI